MGCKDLRCCKNCHLPNDVPSKVQLSMTKLHCINARLHNVPNFVLIMGMNFMHYATEERAIERGHATAHQQPRKAGRILDDG